VADLLIAVLTTVACVYGTSACSKLSGRRAYRAYRSSLDGTALVPAHLLPATAAALAGGESVVAAGLAAAVVLTATALPGASAVAAVSLAAAALLTGILAAGVAVLVHRGTRARCACFGAAASRPVGKSQLSRNLAILAVADLGLAVNAVANGRPAPAGIVVATAAGAVAALLLIRLDDLITVFTPLSRGGAG
jgi:hypothetical protein